MTTRKITNVSVISMLGQLSFFPPASEGRGYLDGEEVVSWAQLKKDLAPVVFRDSRYGDSIL